MTPAEQVDLTVSLWAYFYEQREAILEDLQFFGIIQRKRRLFNRGDIVIGALTNGQGERWPVVGWSSRGFFVKDYYVDFQRFTYRYDAPIESKDRYVAHTNRTQGLMLDTPDEILKRPVFDPVLRAWLVDKAVSLAARPVTADSGTLTSEGSS